MSTTQEHLLISDIKDDIVMLKNGGGALILQVSAVNFGLLSDREQMAIISAFAQMLNSLSYSLQIVIHSERLNINSYLALLDQAQKAQTNELLSKMIINYRQFIQTTIRENEVLDKKFYVVIPLYSLEIGLTSSKTGFEQKVKTVLLPRRDQIIRQLNRIGLKAIQLDRQKLVEVFYDIYNGQFVENLSIGQPQPSRIEVSLKAPKPIYQPTAQPTRPAQNIRQPETPANLPPLASRIAKTHPFVVEELEEV